MKIKKIHQIGVKYKIMRISIIASMDKKRGIGKDNRIPWHITKDLVRLKNLTIGHVTILGRKSFESMLAYYEKSGRSTMSQRTHIVVTKDPNYVIEEKYGLVVNSIEEALRQAQGKLSSEEVFIIGGQQIFDQTIGIVDRLYLTIVDGGFNCDTFFPDYSQFKKIISEEECESKEGHKYKFLTLER
jgi:dihydrofolate reductase